MKPSFVETHSVILGAILRDALKKYLESIKDRAPQGSDERTGVVTLALLYVSGYANGADSLDASAFAQAIIDAEKSRQS